MPTQPGPRPPGPRTPGPRRWRRLRTDERVRGPLRFALALVATDLVVHAWFGASVAAVLGSFAVIVHGYFLDFEGDGRDRATGYATTTAIGLGAIAVGTLCTDPLALAVAATLVVSSVFAFARTLRGYVARAAVGLQVAFFIPLMTGATTADLPDLAVAWLTGSAIAAGVGLVLLPHRRVGSVRTALARWLDATAALARVVRERGDVAPARRAVTDALDGVAATVGDPAHRPGAVSRRHRALVQMTERALWTRPVVARITARRPDDDPTLLGVSESALTAAARLVAGDPVPDPLPDVHAARVADLERLAGAGTGAGAEAGAGTADPDTRARLRAHHEARLFSIVGAAQLWLAAASRGRRLPEPDFGTVTDGTPTELLRAALRWRSVWFANAWRTGLGAAVSVAVVRELGLQQGLWVILAALLCINGAFSAPETGRSLVRMTSGAAAGVLVAAGLLALGPGRTVLVVVLPFAAAMAKLAAGQGVFRAQLAFTPFALVNIAALNWPDDRDLAVVRLEDVLIGAAIAAALSLLVFPYGLTRRLTARTAEVDAHGRAYLTGAVAAARGGPTDDLATARTACLDGLVLLERDCDAAGVHPTEADAAVRRARAAVATARDCLTGGDICADLARRSADDPRVAPVAAASADWWAETLLPAPAGDPA